MERRKKKVSGAPTKTVDSVKDARFAHILKNPIYRPVPKKERKIEIDKRFQGMFNDEKFKLKYKTDKRGRPVETTTDENLKRYYNLEEEEVEEAVEKSTTSKKKKAKDVKAKAKQVEDDKEGEEEDSEDESGSDSAESDEEIEGDVKEDEIKTPLTKLKVDQATRKKLHSNEIDYARGEADFTSDESSDDDSSSAGDENEVSFEHDWGELDKDADRVEDGTRRLALCNMDWDRVRAVDLMVLLSSFLPPGGVIESINIYPSEYGKQRMAEEDVQGPKELVGDRVKTEVCSDDDEDFEDSNDGSGDSEDEDGEGSRYHREKLRQYQLNRLKYYYAVAEFDSRETAEKVYAECDGMEYESSAAKVDLRFIPDEMNFDEDQPKDSCTEMPDSSKYRPRFFTTTALQQIKVDLTWDETDPLRKELTEKIFDLKENVDDDDIRAYLATSSESEEDEDDEAGTEQVQDDPQKGSKQDSISKYKALLQSIETSEKKSKEKDCEMEITWGVGLKETTEKLVKKKMEEDEKAKRTPWEEMQDKQKEKRKQRKHERKRKVSKSDSDSDSSGNEDDQQPFSDDDVDIDMSDEFFRSEMQSNDILKEATKKSKKTKPEKASKFDKPAKDASLELLMMDDDDNKRHFSLKKIIDNENVSKAKKKRNMKKKRKLAEEASDSKNDDFEIDVGDQRFSALFNSHHYNVDPSDPNFKKTKAMEKIITEKQKRRGHGPPAAVETQSTTNDMDDTEAQSKKLGISKKAELSYLVKSIKRNTANLKSKKTKIRR
ncbi:unnamed protein product [Orchesella dallaii]|uniref:ESF1 n=1 Tax=Orchesella dallaii TaxID=48710 RepID=A0ABP1Q787_9HEXA